jgi:hypothetical protein
MRPRVSARLLAGMIALGLSFAGCGNSDEQLMKSLQSWSGSVDFARQQWSAHRVPKSYVVQVLEAAEKQEKNIQEKQGNLRPATKQQLAQLENKVAETSAAIGRAATPAQ